MAIAAITFTFIEVLLLKIKIRATADNTPPLMLAITVHGIDNGHLHFLSLSLTGALCIVL